MSLYSHYDLDDEFERAHDRLDDEIAALSERAVKAEAEADDLQAENHHLREALWRVANKAGDLQTARQIARAALNAKDGD